MLVRAAFVVLTAQLRDNYKLITWSEGPDSVFSLPMGIQPADPLEVRRDDLLERLGRVRPKIVVLLAPAGYGKSTFVGQYLRQSGPAAICDCAGVRDDLDLARRVIGSLASLVTDPDEALSVREMMLGDGGLSVAERVNVALETWRENVPGTVVFENAEHFANIPIAREFFARLFANRPDARTIVVCTRQPFYIHLTRYAAPHEILVIRARDLAFSASDVRAIFSPYVQDARSIARITAVSQGWPIAVLLLKRFAAEGRISAVLDRLDDIAFEELHDYLSSEVVDQLSPAVTEGLFACACIPKATVADLRPVLSDRSVIQELSDLAKSSPFLERDTEGRFAVHPLLAALLMEHREERRIELLRTAALEHFRQKNYARAAELYLEIGDQQEAAHALGLHEVLLDRTPHADYARVLAKLDAVFVQRYPRLWGVTALQRLFRTKTKALLDEAESLWRTLPATASPTERYYIFVFRVLLMSYEGLFDETLAMIERFCRETGVADPPNTMLDGYVLYLRGLLRARVGRLNEGERDLQLGLPFVEEMDVVASGTYLALGADIARVRGERAVERQFIERAIERAHLSRLNNFVAFDYAEALIGAWLAGESALVTRYALELETAVETHGVHGFAFLAAAARGRAAAPTDLDIPCYVAYAHMIALANTSDQTERLSRAHAALAAAHESRRPFVSALAALAAALVDENAKENFLNLASHAADCCESPAFSLAVKAVIDESDDVGMLNAFVTYLAHGHRSVVPLLAVHVAGGTISVDGFPIAIGGRELELVIALAMRRDATPRARLAAMLWPDLQESAARNALSVCLHRVRTHLGRPGAIVRQGDGYALHPQAMVDLWEMDRLAGSVRGRDRLTETQRTTLRRLWRELREERPSIMQRWEWFAATERRLNELRIELGHRLANDALARGETSEALECALDGIACDPCDETAREIAIRSHLLDGDRAAAMRQFRQYRETLLAELQCEPSRSLAALVMQ